MRINRTLKILLGIGTAWYILSPFLGGMIYAVSILALITSGGSGSSDPPLLFLLGLFFFILTLFVNIPVRYLVQGYYLVHVVHNDAGNQAWRTISILGLAFLPFLMAPVYYFIYILPDQPATWALKKSTPEQGD